MLVPLDLRLMAFGLEGRSGLEDRSRSESVDDEDVEARVGEEAEGCDECDWDWDAEVVGMGDEFDVDIAASFVRCSVDSDGRLICRDAVEDSMLEESWESVDLVVGLVKDPFDTRVEWTLALTRRGTVGPLPLKLPWRYAPRRSLIPAIKGFVDDWCRSWILWTRKMYSMCTLVRKDTPSDLGEYI